MSRHLDLDALADLLVGEGAGTDVRHVEACQACRQALDELDQAQAPVRAALAALPPPAVPGDLAARLDAALLEDRSRPSGSTVVPIRRRRRGAADLVLAGAAGVVLLLVVGLAALALGRSGGGDGGSSASSASGALAPSGTRSAATVGSPVTSSSGTDYGAGDDALAAALPVLLSSPRSGPALAPSVEGAADPLARLRDPGELAGCLSALPNPAAPLALDYARYAGRPALVAVLPGPGPTRLTAYVVGAGCRAGAPDTLLVTVLARPS